MVIAEIQNDIDAFERNTALWQEVNFASRQDALDYLEFHVIDRIEGLLQRINPSTELLSLRQYAEQIKRQLEAIDIALFEGLRANIRMGYCGGVTLLNLIDTYAGRNVGNQLASPVPGYDNLDVFTNGLFPVQDLPLATKEREPEMVFYQKTPARIILELVERANLTDEDVVYDLGSGLGHVCILVSLLSGATVRGIEVEPAYCRYAKTCATDLNLSHVSFICEDARKADYSDGTVFFLYTPFEGRILQEVLDKLRAISRSRRITIFTYGPCTPHIARQNWLNGVGQKRVHRYELGTFKSHPTE